MGNLTTIIGVICASISVATKDNTLMIIGHIWIVGGLNILANKHSIKESK